MGWMETVGGAIQYIEDHITDELTIEAIARQVSMSPFYFQKGFAMLCGFTVGEYIRNRRLALAGNDLSAGDEKVIDIALRYGYDTPESFTRAFTRFHGVTPTQVRRDGAILKSFAPLKIRISLEGGYLMDYKIEKKEAFKVLGHAKTFPYEGAKELVPAFWNEHFAGGFGSTVCGAYGVCIDEDMGEDHFEYLIADPYDPAKEIPDGFVVKDIPAHTWAVFPCRGPMPGALQDVNNAIYTEWLPATGNYKFAAGYCIEFYENPADYPKGTQDENYYCEIWIPVMPK